MTTLQIGQKVMHPARSEWGVGEILGMNGTTARVLFENGGLKLINTSFVSLQPAGGRATDKLGWELSQKSSIDIPGLRRLCDQLRDEIRRNQEPAEGSTIAVLVISDIRQFGHLQKGTARLLAQWCKDGAVSVHATDLAQEISKLIYGRILLPNELG